MRTGGGTDPAEGDIGTDPGDGDPGTDPDSDMGSDGGSGTDPDSTIDPDSVTAPGANEEIPAQVQELIDALPAAEEITEENRAEVQEQLEAIEAALEELTDEDKAMLDLARYDAAAAALSAVHRPRRRQSAARNGSVSYLDASGRTQTCSAYTTVTNQTEWNSGWYVLEGNVTISDRITVSGSVSLILENGCTLTASKGITVQKDNSLTIYAQSADVGTMGALKATAERADAAGIGSCSDQNGGTITINGGCVTATGGSSAAGIGGGSNAAGGTITINGGSVTATYSGGGSTGNGIGGGYGGNVQNGAQGTITITGGIVSTNDCIGDGFDASGSTVTISGGSVTAKEIRVSTWGGLTGTFSTGTNGKAVLHISNSIWDEKNKSSWSGNVISLKNIN